MNFTYTYRSSDGERHSAEIEAESRDAAFAKIRTELGIKPIKVVAAEGESRQDGGSPWHPTGGPRSRATVWGAAILAAILLVVLGGVAWWMRSPNRELPATNGDLPIANSDQPITVSTPQGPVTLSVATPLPRQTIPGDRRKIEEAVAQERDPPVFRFAAERWLARFAEPGRQPPVTLETPPAALAPTEATGVSLPRKSATPRGSGALAASSSVAPPRGSGALAASSSVAPPRGSGALAASHATRLPPTDFEAALREPIRIASTDFTEVVDLKRIVTGMKREMRAYLAGGGTVEGMKEEARRYIAAGGSIIGYGQRLVERQEAEIAIYARARTEIEVARKKMSEDAFEDYLEKRNDELRNLGIRPIVIGE